MWTAISKTTCKIRKQQPNNLKSLKDLKNKDYCNYSRPISLQSLVKTCENVVVEVFQ